MLFECLMVIVGGFVIMCIIGVLLIFVILFDKVGCGLWVLRFFIVV